MTQLCYWDFPETLQSPVPPDAALPESQGTECIAGPAAEPFLILSSTQNWQPTGSSDKSVKSVLPSVVYFVSKIHKAY